MPVTVRRRLPSTSEVTRRSPKEDIVNAYRERGWTPLPLRAGQKFPPPAGFTGWDRRRPTARDYREWEGTWGNVALVMSDSVIGIDADLYKPGNALRGIPDTWRSTSRGRIDDDQGSGIYFYRVPPGTVLTGSAPGIGEIIQSHHRYAVAWPSRHPDTGMTYRWYNPEGIEDDMPYVHQLPGLPGTWITKLQDRRPTLGGSRYDGDAEGWLSELRDGPMSPRVQAELRRWTRELERAAWKGTARYDVMVKGTASLVSLGAQRHRGVLDALGQFGDHYLAALDGERDAESELDRAITGAITKFGGR